MATGLRRATMVVPAGCATAAAGLLPRGLLDALPLWEDQLRLVRDVLGGRAQDEGMDDRVPPQQDRRVEYLQALAGAESQADIDQLLASRNLDGLAVIRVGGG